VHEGSVAVGSQDVLRPSLVGSPFEAWVSAVMAVMRAGYLIEIGSMGYVSFPRHEVCWGIQCEARVATCGLCRLLWWTDLKEVSASFL
jgi:hypothetical protein